MLVNDSNNVHTKKNVELSKCKYPISWLTLFFIAKFCGIRVLFLAPLYRRLSRHLILLLLYNASFLNPPLKRRMCAPFNQNVGKLFLPFFGFSAWPLVRPEYELWPTLFEGSESLAVDLGITWTYCFLTFLTSLSP